MIIQPVILSGGAGTRLWPFSRQECPKQFLNLLGTDTLLQQAVTRARAIPGAAAPWVICNHHHRFLVAEQAQRVGGVGRIILEPVGRNTAAAIAVAALMAPEDAILVVLPADHVVANQQAFIAAAHQAIAVAQTGALVTFGITPNAPETGYGYIRLGQPVDTIPGVFRSAQFIEKPALPAAEAMVRAGGYVWNSGMFVLPVSGFLQELEAYQPEVLAACRQAVAEKAEDADFVRIDAEAFARAPSISVDYAVMEHTQHATVVPVDMGWADVGTWASLWQHSPQDEHGNVIRGDVVTENVHNSYVCSQGRLVAISGVNDMVVVATPDVVMVAPKHDAKGVQQLVQTLMQDHRSEAVAFEGCTAPVLPEFAVKHPVRRQYQEQKE